MNVVKVARTKKDLTQTDVADMLNVALSTYRNWEMARTQPNATQLIDLHLKLEIQLDDLMEHFNKK